MSSCATQPGAWSSSPGALNPDGSIVGNDNDDDPLKFEPHYTRDHQPQQVEIFEPILKDAKGRVTTGLLAAVGYLKDNRLLPTASTRRTAGQDIAVIGDAADDPNFNDRAAWSATVSTGKQPARSRRGRALVSAHRLPLGA